MKKKMLLLTALPGALLGYMVLTGYLLSRVKPLPISFLPELPAAMPDEYEEPAAA